MISNTIKSKEYILAIDTHNFPGSIAVGCDNQVLGVIGLQSKVSHTKRLAECVNFLFTQLNIEASQCKAIAINRGPGSFTGLRIGLSFFKGFAFPCGFPIIGFDTFTLIAHSAKIDLPYLGALVDAGRNEIYYKLFEHKDQDMLAITEYCLISPDDILHSTHGMAPEETALVGNGAMKYQNLFKEMGYRCIIPGASFLA